MKGLSKHVDKYGVYVVHEKFSFSEGGGVGKSSYPNLKFKLFMRSFPLLGEEISSFGLNKCSTVLVLHFEYITTGLCQYFRY